MCKIDCLTLFFLFIFCKIDCLTLFFLFIFCRNGKSSVPTAGWSVLKCLNALDVVLAGIAVRSAKLKRGQIIKNNAGNGKRRRKTRQSKIMIDLKSSVLFSYGFADCWWCVVFISINYICKEQDTFPSWAKCPGRIGTALWNLLPGFTFTAVALSDHGDF